MSRIHPDENKSHVKLMLVKQDAHDPSILTVWKRSSMSFQGTDGFTVFDQNGKLVFRLDNYSRKTSSGLTLMDGVGNALLTLKPQMLSMQYQWNAYKGENGCGKKVFSMRSPSLLFHSRKDEAEVFMAAGSTTTTIKQNSGDAAPDFRIQGSFRSRNCNITTSTGQLAAKIARKRVVNTTILLSDDVFSLVVQPGFDIHLIMAFVVILDRICTKSLAPLLCS